MSFGTTNAVVLTAVTVTVGRWAQEKPLSMRVVVGGTVLAIGLAAMNEASPDLAEKFALLIVVMALFTYFPAIAARLKLTGRAK